MTKAQAVLQGADKSLFTPKFGDGYEKTKDKF